MEEGYFLSELSLYFLAILGLLGLWLFHQAQVRSGRIQAVDLFDRSVARLYLYVVPEDTSTCEVCTHANGTVFSNSQVGRKGFSPLGSKCSAPAPCPGFLIGLYGGWPEAREIVARLARTPKKSSLKLSPEEVCAMVKGDWKRSVSADTDRVAVHLLYALYCEKVDANGSIEAYRYVIEHSKESRHSSFVVPAYIRMIRLLVQTGGEDEARRAIEQFERRFQKHQQGPYSPSAEQRRQLEEQKSLLWERQSLQISA